MSSIDHTFDWKGFIFTLKTLAACFLCGVGAYSGVLYVESLILPPSPPASIEVATTPLPQTALVPTAEELTLSSSTPQRVLNALTIQDVIPAQGKFIAADLVHMKLYLYQDGTTTAEYPIITKGKPGKPWETPSGFYAIQTKEETHFSSIGHVYMPYSMQFYGNYFIHGWTYYPDGTPVSASFSGGCIKLSTEDAAKAFAFADVGTKVFVYDAEPEAPPQTLSLSPVPTPNVDAAEYLVADIDTGDVYAEKNAAQPRPIASVTKLMTALVANETISLDKKVTVPEGVLFNPPVVDNTTPKTFYVDDLFYPLLMQSSNGVAETLASYYGEKGFVRWMNTTARALDMASSTFADASGISPDNISTPEDLFRLITYLTHKKSFVLNITDTQHKTITATDGTTYEVKNVNAPADMAPFEGGKVGHTTAAQDTMVSVLSFAVGTTTRHIAVIVLGSQNQAQDTEHLAQWVTNAAQVTTSQTACASCTTNRYRTIQL